MRMFRYVFFVVVLLSIGSFLNAEDTRDAGKISTLKANPKESGQHSGLVGPVRSEFLSQTVALLKDGPPPTPQQQLQMGILPQTIHKRNMVRITGVSKQDSLTGKSPVITFPSKKLQQGERLSPRGKR